jgi:hypothetical protein
MREPGWQGVRRGKQQRTTIPDQPASRSEHSLHGTLGRGGDYGFSGQYGRPL